MHTSVRGWRHSEGSSGAIGQAWGAFAEPTPRLLWPPALTLEDEGALGHTGHTSKTGPALGAPHTCVWIRFRPRNHRIWPRRSSRSAWSISSTSSFNSSSGISSFCVSRPASFRNLSLLVGMVAMTCKGCTGQGSGLRIFLPVPESLFLPSHM